MNWETLGVDLLEATVPTLTALGAGLLASDLPPAVKAGCVVASYFIAKFLKLYVPAHDTSEGDQAVIEGLQAELHYVEQENAALKARVTRGAITLTPGTGGAVPATGGVGGTATITPAPEPPATTGELGVQIGGSMLL